jgi:transmembrane sensor
MQTLPDSILRLAFDLDEYATLNKEQQDICEEWRSGRGADLMKISIEESPTGYYEKLEASKNSIWERKIKPIYHKYYGQL